MASRYEAGTYTKRGFASVDNNGACERISNWLGRSYANGGAGWTLVDDKSAVNSGTFTVPDHTNDLCYRVGHGFSTGQDVFVSSSSTLPWPLNANTLYRVIYVDVDNFKLAGTLLLSLAGTNIDISTAGAGTFTITAVPYKVYCSVATPVVNTVANFLKISYIVTSTTTFTNSVRLTSCLWWDAVNHIPRGIWDEHYLACATSTSNSYWFNGNTDFINIVLKVGSSTHSQFSFGMWVGNPLLVESASLTGTLAAGVTADSFVVMSLGVGEAANFTVGKWYFIYDFDAHSWVEYVKVTGRDLGIDTITVQLLNYNFPAGAKLGAYPHRFYIASAGLYSGGGVENSDNTSGSRASRIPYTASTTGVPSTVFHSQTSTIRSSISCPVCETLINSGNPEDEGRYYAQTPVILESESNSSTNPTPRLYGKMEEGNIYVTFGGDMTAALSVRLINGKKYTPYVPASFIFHQGSSSLWTLIPSEDL